MTKKGLEVLHAVADCCRDHIEMVVTARDPAVEKDYHDEIVTYCRERAIPVRERSESFSLRAPYAIAASWRWLLTLPRTRLIVFHDSILPRYRGFNPLVSCLINGERKIGVTALFASEQYDCGDIVDQAEVEIEYPITIRDAIDRVGLEYGRLAGRIAMALCRGEKLPATPQDETRASYSLWRDEDDYCIEWSRPACWIKRFVDAVGWPYKSASTWVGGCKARVHHVTVLEDVAIENRSPGKVIFIRDGMPVVVCGEGLVRIDAMTDDATARSLLPMSRLRMRFQSCGSDDA
jgi:methionyl-tRNA formyltransferase